jgi:hypothetical protein
LRSLPAYFSEGRPTTETAQTLRDELLFQRATQTYVWALPLVNTLGMKSGSEKVFGSGYNVLPICGIGGGSLPPRERAPGGA